MSSASHGPLPRALPLRNFSRVEYDKMIDAGVLGEGEHVELVGEAIVEISPEGPHHAGTIDLLAELLRRTFGPGFTIRVQHPLTDRVLEVHRGPNLGGYDERASLKGGAEVVPIAARPASDVVAISAIFP